MADDDDYEFEEVSDEEKMKIAQHFLLSSPPGQINLVLADVKKLMPDGLLSDDTLSGIFRAYNLQTCCAATLPGSKDKILISSQAEVDAVHYVCPKAGKVVGFDHIKQQCVEDDIVDHESEMDDTSESYRRGVQASVDKYLDAQFAPGIATSAVYLNEGVLTIVLCAEKINLSNFWSGRWTSGYTVNMTATTAKVTGETKLHAHYFEDGNVQLQTKRQFEADEFTHSSPETLGEEIVRVIKDFEDSVQQGLEMMFANMSDETFRAMRRVMTVQRSKMNWNIAAHKVVNTLRQ